MRRVAPAAGAPSPRDVYTRHSFTRSDGYVWAAYDSGAGAFASPAGTRHPRPHVPPERHHVGRSSSSSAESSRALPRICIRESDGCDVDEAEGPVLCLDGAGTPCSVRQPRRPGKTISTGHKNYHLMLNLQLGIRHAVGKSAAKLMRPLKRTDFDPGEKFSTRFPPAGSKLTPPHQSSEFRWKDYCPMVFRHMMELFAVSPANYMLAICGDDALRGLSSPGKSGSFFYLTQDERFMIKTVKKSEVKLLIRMLPSYYKHVRRYKSSLITRFYGVHSVKPNGGQKVRFIVMGNLFCAEHRIHRRYDLKGSSYGRKSDKFGEDTDGETTLKDLDLNFVFRIQQSRHKQLHEQLRRDCAFLESEGIMDYSLLVGVHFRDDIPGSKVGLSTLTTSDLSANMASTCQGSVSMPKPCLSAKDLEKMPYHRKPLVRLGTRLPARAERRMSSSKTNSFLSSSRGSENRVEAYDVLLYFGVIDILRDYDISKKLEHAYKSLQADPGSISAVDPRLYSQRFRDFMSRVFVKEG
ncbi:hypothetical protein QYE76_002801 [Lolium multiflorum]|uniref:1-phosphatidylinositol-4-phosphate 5-kinase n=1 Tax=Lolium multiflorum TaxID=4521 RepID=A0AAD8W0Z1_LOLMU|nr:hypothetical protein QYE76_002801 [Lolium multiflorum]